MKLKGGVIFFGWTEITIGLITIISLLEARMLGFASKPLPVFLFVFITSSISLVLGAGILDYRMWARKLLMFFAGYIALTKLLILFGVVRLSSPFETLMPPTIKNWISLAYHMLVVLFMNREKTRRLFKH